MTMFRHKETIHAVLCDGCVQRGVEDIVVSQPRTPAGIERGRHQERHGLLTETAVRAPPMSGELTEIVILPPRADNR